MDGWVGRKRGHKCHGCSEEQTALLQASAAGSGGPGSFVSPGHLCCCGAFERRSCALRHGALQQPEPGFSFISLVCSAVSSLVFLAPTKAKSFPQRNAELTPTHLQLLLYCTLLRRGQPRAVRKTAFLAPCPALPLPGTRCFLHPFYSKASASWGQTAPREDSTAQPWPMAAFDNVPQTQRDQ